MKSYTIMLSCLICMVSFSLQAQNTLSQARIFINPGHGGWGSNDRPMATINYPALDSMSFFESKMNLWKAQGLQAELTKAGAGFILMSRTVTGIDTNPTSSPNSQYPEILEGTVVDGVTQNITLSVICEEVEANNMDYFISIHSNANVDGDMVNYPLVLYRGTDAAVGNGLTYAKDMATAAWPYIVKNDITYHSAYTTSSNVRGDITFYGSSATTTAGGTSYTGYLGVLRHGCDGFLCEGGFHTYQPERQRFMNRDYCRQEGVRYSRAIRAWFGDNTETKGCIMGSIKDKSRSLINSLYNFKVGTNDAYYPLNGATVSLQDLNGQEIATYTTDGQYNGVFVFTDLTPGTYKLIFDGTGFDKDTAQVSVTANATTFLEQTVGEIPVNTACIDFKDPVQDASVTAAASYNFEQIGSEITIDALANLTVRRAILHDGKYYILAVDASKNPRLLVIDPGTGALIKEMSTAGISTTGYNGKSHVYNLSDIAFTADGVLIGTNSTVVGNVNNIYQTGNFYVYKWEANGTVALEDAAPQVLIMFPTNVVTSIAPFGNNNSNFAGNSIAVSGCSNDFKLYFDSHPGNTWDTSIGNFNMLYMGWRITNGVFAGSQRNTIKYTTGNTDCKSLQINLSPLGDDRFVLDGSQIEPTEVLFNWATDAPTYSDFSGNIPTSSAGATYFKYAGKMYMSTPVCEKQADNTYAYTFDLFDVTSGLNNAVKVGGIDSVLINGNTAMSYMTSAGVVNNADIDIYLLAGNKLVHYRTEQVNTGINNPDVKSIHVIRTPMGIQINLNKPSKIELYNISGQLIEKTTTSGIYSRNLPNGIYILRVNGQVIKFVR